MATDVAGEIGLRLSVTELVTWMEQEVLVVVNCHRSVTEIPLMGNGSGL